MTSLRNWRIRPNVQTWPTPTATAPTWGTTNPVYTSIATVTNTVTLSTGSVLNAMANALYSSQHTANPFDSVLVRDTLRLMGDCTIEDGVPCKVGLPDGGVLEVNADGSYRINDKDAKVTYRANKTRDFNPFINASDKLEAFIQFCGALGVKQSEMLNIPIKLFIGWLIIEAARADGDEADVELLDGIYDHVRPRCTCGRFISPKKTERRIFFCRTQCLERELAA